MIDVLFVCSGNTCRSPMAECLFNARCAALGLPYRADSAGLYARAGAPASDGAFAAMKARGLSLSRHAAQPATPALMRGARQIVAMSAAHAAACRERCPEATIEAFDPPIPDPFGGSDAVYRQTADALETAVEALIARLGDA